MNFTLISLDKQHEMSCLSETTPLSTKSKKEAGKKQGGGQRQANKANIIANTVDL